MVTLVTALSIATVLLQQRYGAPYIMLRRMCNNMHTYFPFLPESIVCAFVGKNDSAEDITSLYTGLSVLAEAIPSSLSFLEAVQPSRWPWKVLDGRDGPRSDTWNWGQVPRSRKRILRPRDPNWVAVCALGFRFQVGIFWVPGALSCCVFLGPAALSRRRLWRLWRALRRLIRSSML